MLFDVTKSSDWSYRGQVNINSLEELFLFLEFNQKDIVIHRPKDDQRNYEINICDCVGSWE